MLSIYIISMDTDTNLEVLDFYSLPEDDFRAIIKSANGKHVYASQYTKQENFCTCIGYRVHKHCTHIIRLLHEITLKGEHKTMESTKYVTKIDGLNKVLLGGIPKGVLTGFYGLPQAGKSTVAIWALMEAMRLSGKSGVIIDTETGLAKHFLPDLVDRFNSANETDIGVENIRPDYRNWLRSKSAIIPYRQLFNTDKEQKIVVIDINNLNELFLLLGRPYKVDLDSAKPNLQPHSSQLWENIWDTPLAQILDDPNAEQEFCGFILDSLTSMMKLFGTANQVYPARDTAQSVIINQLAGIINEFDDMMGINILHASRPPADSSKRPIPVGGKSVGHGHKFIVQFNESERQGLNTLVNVISYRLPTKLGNLAGYTIIIDDKGVK